MFDLLAQRNIQRVTDRLVDVRQYPARLKMINRYPIIPAMDGEIFARFRGRILAADIIAKDAKAPMRALPEVELQQNILPILKHGYSFNREEIRLLRRIEDNMVRTQERDMFIGRVGMKTTDLTQGVWTTMNVLMYGMLLDEFHWHKNGIHFDSTWGMPSDLKVTLTGADLWSAPTTATPVDDLNSIRKTARVKYGVELNRAEMSQVAFDYMIRTTEFINLAKSLFALGSASTIDLPYNNSGEMMTLAQRVTGLPTIDIDDTMYFTEENDASIQSRRNLPERDVLLTSTADDGDTGVFDFANAEVEEAMPGMVPSMIGTPEGGPYGPFSYATAADPQGNPPGLNLWSVASGFPRKHMEAHSARLRVTA
jgi:hypothetical protein